MVVMLSLADFRAEEFILGLIWEEGIRKELTF